MAKVYRRRAQPHVRLCVDLVLQQDEAGLLAALESFEQSTLPWLERLVITSADPLKLDDAGDDLTRELRL